MAEIATADEVETIRSVAIDICKSESTRQNQLKRVFAYLERVESDRGEEFARHAYNILWATILTYREIKKEDQSGQLKNEFLKSIVSLPGIFLVAVIGGLILAWLTNWFGLGPVAPSQAKPSEQTTTDPAP